MRTCPAAVYNQIANFVVTPSEINIAIWNKEPKVYFTELPQAVQWRKEDATAPSPTPMNSVAIAA